MRRFLLMAWVLLYAYACMHPDEAERRTSDNFSSERQGPDPFEASLYIGDVDYFFNSNEFYTPLFLRDRYENAGEDWLETRLDSVIEQNEDWGRERLPMEEAEEYFILTGLDTLSIYDTTHTKVCDCPLKRVEYFWNGMETRFVAVFANTGNPVSSEAQFYGVGQAPERVRFPAFAVDILQDPGFDAHVMGALDFRGNANWRMRHYALRRPPLTYSVVSAETETAESLSWLTLHEEDRITILNEEVNSVQYLGIVPIPILVNDKPLLLMSVGYPSSDMAWEYLAAYDGAGYDAVAYNRIRLASRRHNDLELRHALAVNMVSSPKSVADVRQ